jgi:hypothetical protein
MGCERANNMKRHWLVEKSKFKIIMKKTTINSIAFALKQSLCTLVESFPTIPKL